MPAPHRSSRILIIAGLVAMVIGALDPLEGSLVILPGTIAAALGARLAGSRDPTFLYWGAVLVTVGVGTMWGMSAIGGLGESTGRSLWWALLLLPYPVGWVLGLIGAARALRQGRGDPAPPAEG
jgi:hypothetical protein